MVASAKEYAIFTMDASGNIDSWNSGAERLFGYSEAEILGRDGRILYAPEVETDFDRLGWELETALSKGQAENECWHLRKDGSRLWGSGFLMPLCDKADEVQGFIKIMRDITAQREAEERLRLLYDITSDLLAAEQPTSLMRNMFGKLAPPLGLDSFYNFIVEEKKQPPGAAFEKL
ncbi:MAG: PAS domain S-box protein [Oscillatoriales cyanobacterium RU_3_3]|nr:PAS domain S-box protein [Oscillatoriales cyanobacterium RU_3_3]